MGTIALSVVTVFALAGVSFAGIRTLNGTGERGLMPADISPYDSGRYPVFERTAVIESLSVTSPSDSVPGEPVAAGGPDRDPVLLGELHGRGRVRAGRCQRLVCTEQAGQCGWWIWCHRFLRSEWIVNGNCTSSASPETDLGGLPVLHLSNRDLGLSMPACGLGGTPPMPMTGDDAVMAVV